MKEKIYIDRLFTDYEDTPEIRDFKEEIAGNLNERIKELISKGYTEEKAFDKATAELGDITAIADAFGKKKRTEAIGRMYMGAKTPITKRTAAGMTAATTLLLLAVGTALITAFSPTGKTWVYYVSGVLLSIACGLYTYFGLTQETKAHYAMKTERAIAYGAVCLVGVLSAALAVVTFVFEGLEMSVALGFKAALIIPAVSALVFLLATESKRQKPWLKAITELYERKIGLDIENSIKLHSMSIVNPVKAAKFGVISGGLWIMAIALFFTLNLVIGWNFAWLVFLFALAIQVIMVSTIFEKS